LTVVILDSTSWKPGVDCLILSITRDAKEDVFSMRIDLNTDGKLIVPIVTSAWMFLSCGTKVYDIEANTEKYVEFFKYIN
jgi:hypothetical protein